MWAWGRTLARRGKAGVAQGVVGGSGAAASCPKPGERERGGDGRGG